MRKSWAPIMVLARAHIATLRYLATLREVHYHLVGVSADLGYRNVRNDHARLSGSRRRHPAGRQLCVAAGVPVATLHTARHSAVTAMRNAGVADHMVAAFAGHEEVVMRRTYSHADSEGLAAAGRALADMWKAAPMT